MGESVASLRSRGVGGDSNDELLLYEVAGDSPTPCRGGGSVTAACGEGASEHACEESGASASSQVAVLTSMETRWRLARSDRRSVGTSSGIGEPTASAVIGEHVDPEVLQPPPECGVKELPSRMAAGVNEGVAGAERGAEALRSRTSWRTALAITTESRESSRKTRSPKCSVSSCLTDSIGGGRFLKKDGTPSVLHGSVEQIRSTDPRSSEMLNTPYWAIEATRAAGGGSGDSGEDDLRTMPIVLRGGDRPLSSVVIRDGVCWLSLRWRETRGAGMLLRRAARACSCVDPGWLPRAGGVRGPPSGFRGRVTF